MCQLLASMCSRELLYEVVCGRLSLILVGCVMCVVCCMSFFSFFRVFPLVSFLFYCVLWLLQYVIVLFDVWCSFLTCFCCCLFVVIVGLLLVVVVRCSFSVVMVVVVLLFVMCCLFI